MTEQPTHLKALEEIEREGIPGLVEVLREEGLDAARRSGQQRLLEQPRLFGHLRGADRETPGLILAKSNY